MDMNNANKRRRMQSFLTKDELEYFKEKERLQMLKHKQKSLDKTLVQIEENNKGRSDKIVEFYKRSKGEEYIIDEVIKKLEKRGYTNIKRRLIESIAEGVVLGWYEEKSDDEKIKEENEKIKENENIKENEEIKEE